METLLVFKETQFCGNVYLHGMGVEYVHIEGLSRDQGYCLLGSVIDWVVCAMAHMHTDDARPTIAFGKEIDGDRLVISVTHSAESAIEKIRDEFAGLFEEIQVENWTKRHHTMMMDALTLEQKLELFQVLTLQRLAEEAMRRERMIAEIPASQINQMLHPELN